MGPYLSCVWSGAILALQGSGSESTGVDSPNHNSRIGQRSRRSDANS